MRHTYRAVKGRRDGRCWAFLVVSGKESARQCRRRRLDPWARKIPWRRKSQPTLVFLLGNPTDRGGWWATVHIVVVQSLSHVRLFATPWTVAHQDSLSLTVSQSLLKLMSTESVMPSNHLILCHPLLLLPSIFWASGSFPVNRLFTSLGQSLGASASASVLPVNIQGWFPLGLTVLATKTTTAGSVRRGRGRSLWPKWCEKEGFLEEGTVELSLEGQAGLGDHGDWEWIPGQRTPQAQMQRHRHARGRPSPELQGRRPGIEFPPVLPGDGVGGWREPHSSHPQCRTTPLTSWSTWQPWTLCWGAPWSTSSSGPSRSTTRTAMAASTARSCWTSWRSVSAEGWGRGRHLGTLDAEGGPLGLGDRKSTRLNSSHQR